jgi:hypothetical protein
MFVFGGEYNVFKSYDMIKNSDSEKKYICTSHTNTNTIVYIYHISYLYANILY